MNRISVPTSTQPKQTKQTNPISKQNDNTIIQASDKRDFNP
jgi:hypothetical protein